MLPWMKWGLTAIAFFAVVIWGWIALYPDPDDPRNMTYVMWKNGLSEMDIEQAVYTLGRDHRARATMIAGKSEAELRHKFGYVVRPSEASPWLRQCFENSDWKGTDVRFIRNTDLIVVFKNGRATDSWVFKPC